MKLHLSVMFVNWAMQYIAIQTKDYLLLTFEGNNCLFLLKTKYNKTIKANVKLCNVIYCF